GFCRLDSMKSLIEYRYPVAVYGDPALRTLLAQSGFRGTTSDILLNAPRAPRLTNSRASAPLRFKHPARRACCRQAAFKFCNSPLRPYFCPSKSPTGPPRRRILVKFASLAQLVEQLTCNQ